MRFRIYPQYTAICPSPQIRVDDGKFANFRCIGKGLPRTGSKQGER